MLKRDSRDSSVSCNSADTDSIGPDDNNTVIVCLLMDAVCSLAGNKVGLSSCSRSVMQHCFRLSCEKGKIFIWKSVRIQATNYPQNILIVSAKPELFFAARELKYMARGSMQLGFAFVGSVGDPGGDCRIP